MSLGGPSWPHAAGAKGVGGALAGQGRVCCQSPPVKAGPGWAVVVFSQMLPIFGEPPFLNSPPSPLFIPLPDPCLLVNVKASGVQPWKRAKKILSILSAPRCPPLPPFLPTKEP